MNKSIIINTSFFDGINLQDLKKYIKDLKEERELIRSKIDNVIINTIFEDGKNIELQHSEKKISSKIMEMYNGLMYKINYNK